MSHRLDRFAPLALIVFAASCGEATIDSPVSPVESSNDDVTYDPSTCKTDAEGMVYFSLGREVFRRPAEDDMTIRGLSDEERAALPPRPNPFEPEGCPDNPIWGSNFTITYRHQPADPGLYAAGTPFSARSISIIEIPERKRLPSGELEPLNWGLQPSLERAFARVKEQYGSCELLANGLNACRVPSPGREILSWTTKFQADPEIYDAPFDRPFTVSCSAWGAIDQQDCRVSYNYSGSIRIAYQFELHELPPLEIIEFDKGVRSAVESMRVRDFRWADE